jgi:hypothetical protein
MLLLRSGAIGLTRPYVIENAECHDLLVVLHRVGSAHRLRVGLRHAELPDLAIGDRIPTRTRNWWIRGGPAVTDSTLPTNWRCQAQLLRKRRHRDTIGRLLRL